MRRRAESGCPELPLQSQRAAALCAGDVVQSRADALDYALGNRRGPMKPRRLITLAAIVSIATWALANASSPASAADSAADVQALPTGEFKSVLGKRTVDLDAEEIRLVVKLIDEMEKPSAGGGAVGQKLRDGTKM